MVKSSCWIICVYAEENYEFLPEDAAKTIMVSRLWKLFDLCVLDSFPSAHRSHPSIVGFPNVIPACAGRIVEKEVLLDEILSVAISMVLVLLGSSKLCHTRNAKMQTGFYIGHQW